MSHHAPLILDIAGTALTAADRKRLQHPLTGGVILFGRNWVNRQQLTQLCVDIKAVRQDLLICVDHEGGRVQRFRTDGFTHIPPMRALGELWMKDSPGVSGEFKTGSGAMAAMDAATASGYVLASELRACGVDFSFTPVLDLDHGESGVIGDRSFHRDPRVVSALAKSVMHGLLLAGMANCGKHFPGHGFVTADSHVDIPVDKRSLKAHVIYPKVDALPAGFSPRWLQDILRGQLHFNGAIFSDDLSMEGARRIEGRAVSFAEAGMAALNAGCDLVLLCNQSLGDGHAVDEMLAGLTEQLIKNQWSASEASEQRRRALLPQTSPLAWDALMTHPAYVRALDLLP
jgi:beta-N-acetylhexosaminidase